MGQKAQEVGRERKAKASSPQSLQAVPHPILSQEQPYLASGLGCNQGALLGQAPKRRSQATVGVQVSENIKAREPGGGWEMSQQAGERGKKVESQRSAHVILHPSPSQVGPCSTSGHRHLQAAMVPRTALADPHGRSRAKARMQAHGQSGARESGGQLGSTATSWKKWDNSGKPKSSSPWSP